MILRKEALQGLLDAVEAGDADQSFDGMGFGHISRARYAFNGSLNAFVALAGAVLPGWWWQVSAPWDGKAHVALYPPKMDSAERSCGSNPDPARAGLIAILKALIAKECEA